MEGEQPEVENPPAEEVQEQAEAPVENGEVGQAPAQEMEAAEEPEEVPEEAPQPKSNSNANDPRIQWMTAELENLEPYSGDKNFLTNDKLQKFADFLDNTDYKKFFCWIELNSDELSWSFDKAPRFYGGDIKPEDYQVVFYLKLSGEKITENNMQRVVMTGMIDRDPLDDLLAKMKQEYCPKLLGENDWPDGVKKEFATNLHKFMCTLTEASHKRRGKTQLYIPIAEELHDVEAAAREKDQIQRLEAIVIYWTRQIKELVTNQEGQQSGDNLTPLDEIKHWTDRYQNLRTLMKTLENKNLQKIIEVLQRAQSSYHPQFLELTARITDEFETANDSLKFLTILQDPCRRIDSAQPRDIPKMLPEVLNCVRMIFELSNYYNNSDRMRGLMTRISNQIIQRCKAKIEKEDMLGRDVEKCMSDLDESIECCKQWKEIADHKMRMIKHNSTRAEHWDLEKDETIFAEIDAFIQRCRDLKEICDGQLQFAQRGASCEMPIFGSTKGKEYQLNLEDLKLRFDVSLRTIENLDYDILDVKQTKWHDDFGQNFKEEVKGIETFYTTIINNIFKYVSTCSDAVEMLENFQQLSKRASVQEYVHTKAASRVYEIFLQEVKEIETQFDLGAGKNKRPPMPVSHPQYGGLAIWALSLITRLNKIEELMEKMYFVPNISIADDVKDKFHKLSRQLDGYIANVSFREWTNTLEDMSDADAVDQKLAVPVLRKAEADPAAAAQQRAEGLQKNSLVQKTNEGKLRSNFNVHLLKVINECTYWNKIQANGYISMPHSIVTLIQKSEHLRKLRENVMTVVREFNNIQELIAEDERELFAEHLATLDRHILPGIVKHDWRSSSIEFFVMGCRQECENRHKLITTFQQTKGDINAEIEKISNTTLTQIQKRLYELPLFINVQEGELRRYQTEFQNSLNMIHQKLVKIYKEMFIERQNPIQKTYAKFVAEVDKSFKEALKNSVKNTFYQLSNHIKTEGSDVVAIFKVYTKLDKTSGASWTIVHEPNHPTIRAQIVALMEKIRNFTIVLERLEVLFRKDREGMVNEKIDEIIVEKQKNGGGNFSQKGEVTRESLEERWKIPSLDNVKLYPEQIWQSKSVKQIYEQVKREIDKIKVVLEEDEKRQMVEPEFRQLMNMQTDRGKRRFLRSTEATDPEDPVANYRTTIEQMQNNMIEMANKNSTAPRFFIQLDYTNLRNDQKECARKLIMEIQVHLIEESKKDLNQLLELLDLTVEKLKKNCTSLDMLKEHKARHAEVKQLQPQWNARILPIKKKFEYIKSWQDDGEGGEVEGLNEDDIKKVESLEEAWKNFLQGMWEANQIITRNFAEQKAEMENQISDLKQEVNENMRTFNKECPRSIESKGLADPEENRRAHDKIAEFRLYCQELRKRETEMIKGLEVFDIPADTYTELEKVEKENEHLSSIWTIKSEWDDQWMQWKDIQFYNLDVDGINEAAYVFKKNLQKLKDKNNPWPVYETLYKRMEDFGKTMPMLGDLRDESMRDRHWDQVRLEVKDDFQEKSDEFCLETVFQLNFLEYENEIGNLTDEAKKQLKVEKDLDDIEFKWEKDPESDLQIAKERSKADNEEFYKVAGTQNIMDLIEDHSVKLATHKASPFYKEFAYRIDPWEKNLADITTILDSLIVATSSWQYLESIFCGQPDIIRSMADENAKFQQGNKIFKAQMVRIAKEKNCYRALVANVKDFGKVLDDLNGNFDSIKKSMIQFLDSKRGKFPRFYFLPHEDLLEIIGMGKDPKPLNKHIKKIFAGVHSLEAEPAPKTASAKYYIKAIEAEGKEESIELDVGATDQKKLEVEVNCEDWLKELIHRMREALQRMFKHTQQDQQSTAFQRRIKEHIHMRNWVNIHKGQFLVTDCQIRWSNDVRNHLLQLEKLTQVNPNSSSHPLKIMKKQYAKLMATYVDVVEKTPGLSALERKKLTALIIVEEHHRDVIDKLCSYKNISRGHFAWLSQLRFTLKEPEGADNLFNVEVEQMNSVFDYGYEYQGNQPRLVITELTDRAYMTLTNALSMFRGGAPQGPAGTGKTETVKDLGKNLAFFVLVQNCDNLMTPESLSKIFAGLASSGAWGCFDEFNRISLDVLSVIAVMFEAMFDCQKRGDGNACQLGEITAAVSKDAGYFITMNPGYAGRSALPDNLAALFRPVAMMKADFVAIAKIELMSTGFKEGDPLSVKIVSMYSMMERQLSKAHHYEFQMRSLKSVLRACGAIKQGMPQLNETSVAIKAIRDMNLSKLLPDDVFLFDKLFEDLFPDCEEPEINMDDLQISLEDNLEEMGLELNECMVVKAMQLYEQFVIRWGVMIIGPTMSGKSTIIKVLEKAQNRLAQQLGGDKYKNVKMEKMNPKAIHENEFYGHMDESQQPPQWMDGVFSHLFRTMILEPQNVARWLLMDGPVDTLWIESMNSLLDDSKTLTMNNGDRLSLTPNCKLLFEVADLDQASPATISRVGLVYMDPQELGYVPALNVWISNKKQQNVGLRGEEYKDLIQNLSTQYVFKVMKIKQTTCKEMVKTSELACIKNFTQLFDSIMGQYKKGEEEDTEGFKSFIHRIFVFALIWSVGATLREESRKELDLIIRDLDPIFPHANTVFEYYVHPEKKDFSSWEDYIGNIKPAPGTAFHDIYVPTMDTVRYREVMSHLLRINQHIMFVGNSGVGKTKRIMTALEALPEDKIMTIPINFSAGTTADATQDIIMNGYEERARKWRPKGARAKAIAFVDDFNMPRKEEYGAMPPIELIRQVMDTGFWYNRKKLIPEHMLDLEFIAAMGEPGGGRQELTDRIVSNFHLICFTFPSESVMKRIYEQIVECKFNGFYEDIRVLIDQLPIATIQIFSQVKATFLPTPALIHYQFNMRDISKVFQGIFKADKSFYDTKEQMVKLWGHEIQRVFQDRLAQIPGVVEDQTRLKDILDEILGSTLQGMSYKEHVATPIDEETSREPIFVDFLGYDDMRVYEEVTDMNKLKVTLESNLENYNAQGRVAKLDMVLFQQAIIMVARVHRVLSMERGHVVLAGLPSVGRKTVVRLAAFVEQMIIQRLEVTKNFGVPQFRGKMKQVMEEAGYGKKDNLNTVFILEEQDIQKEAFLEDIQNILSSGLIPNLYSNDEKARIADEMKMCYKMDGQTDETQEAKIKWYEERVTNHLHIAYIVDQSLKLFGKQCNSFPALINNTNFIFYFPWPNEGLYEVAERFIGNVEPLPEGADKKIARVCTDFYDKCLTSKALHIKQTQNRNCDLLPSLYTQFMLTYKEILSTKRAEIGALIDKYRNGIVKLEHANEEVKTMAAKSEEKNAFIAVQKQAAEVKEAEINSKKKTIDAALEAIAARTKVVEAEKIEATNLAESADKELARAMPALEAANEAVDKLEGKYIAEMKSMNVPHQDTHMVMMAVMTFLGQPTPWAEIKKVISKPTFKDSLFHFDKENIPQSRLTKVQKFTRMESFNEGHMFAISRAAAALCVWVKAIEEYAQALKVVVPKREKKEAAEAKVKAMEEELAAMQRQFDEMQAELDTLQKNYDNIMKQLDEFQKEIAKLSLAIDRGEQLVSGLSGEKTRWTASQLMYEEVAEKLVGDCLIAAGLISFMGPYPQNYRTEITKEILQYVKSAKIDHDPDFQFVKFMTNDAQIREWQVKDLPTDDFSTQNAVVITKSNKWCMIIDPQNQARDWIVKKTGKSLNRIDFKNIKYGTLLERAVSNGKNTLLEDVGQSLDPTLVNIISKNFFGSNPKKRKVQVGDREIDWAPKFALVLTTKIANPTFSDMITQATTIVNFCVTEFALEEQCLNIVIQLENANLETNRIESVKKIADNNAKLQKLEDDILASLNNDSGIPLLEDVELIQTLNTAKDASDEAKSQAEGLKISMKKIMENREMYRPIAKKASALYFVLFELNIVDAMYQFSLQWYKDLFQKSISEAPEGPQQERAKSIVSCHTLNVYRKACRTLFERHKLLLSLQMCIKLMMAEGLIDSKEYSFFLRGGTVLQREGQPVRPPGAGWITDQAWDNICELEKQIDHFAGLANSIQGQPQEWKRWFSSVQPDPEKAQLPGEWETKCEDVHDLKKMIILRCFRPDRVMYAIKNFINAYFKTTDYTVPKTVSIQDSYEESDPETPIIFIMAPGVDPTENLKRYAEELGVSMAPISLGKGQEAKAKAILKSASSAGKWCFLSNCHLSVQLLPELENMMDEIFSQQYDSNFRVMMSAAPVARNNEAGQFPISLLQRSIKQAVEPPKGMKANVLRTYSNMPKVFTRCENDMGFRKAVYGLVWYHALLIERKKFKSLGWNTAYSFNDSDYQVCEDQLAQYMGKYINDLKDDKFNIAEPVPWDAVRELIGQCNYGGRVTDNSDRTLLMVYTREIFNDELIAIDKWKPPGTEHENYTYIVDESNTKANIAELWTPEVFQTEIGGYMHEGPDPTSCFGQHPNAEISSLIADTTGLLMDIVSLQPLVVEGSPKEKSAMLLKKIKELAEIVPASIDLGELKHKLSKDDNPLNTVLLQEMQRYNALLNMVAKNLFDLERGVQGLSVITPELNNVLEMMGQNRVPPKWGSYYFSLKSLSRWLEDLIGRMDFFMEWCQRGLPFVFNMSCFTYPQGFTTALLQRFSRKSFGANIVSIDKLEFDFLIIQRPVADIQDYAKDGAYVTGLILEGAKWNDEKMYLTEPGVMELEVPMPVVHFKPINRRKPPTNVYNCPVYYYPIRAGTVSRDSYIMSIDLKSGEYPPEFWIKRGTALLLSTAN